jgi:hypothetical protein
MDDYVDDPSVIARDEYVPPMDDYVDDPSVIARDEYVPPVRDVFPTEDYFDPVVDDPSVIARDEYVPPVDEYREPVVVEPEPPEYHDPVVVEPEPPEYYDPVVDDPSVSARDEFVPEYVDEGKPGEPAPTESQQPTDYEVQPWENLDESGYGTGSMAGDNSLNSGNNTYTGPVENTQEQGLPDEFGRYAADAGSDEYTGGGDYVDYGDDGGDGGGYGGYDAYGGFDDYMNGYDPGYYGGGEGYSWNGEANGGLIGHARGGLMAMHRYAMGGTSNLGGYSDGGRLLKGPGDGVSDSIPASIGKNRQPARLADGEFVVPARIVSELGNGSTEAGARKLYAMMDRIQKARSKTVGKNRVATNSRADKHLPA